MDADCSRKLMRPGMLQRCKDMGYKDVKECVAKDQLCVNACNKLGTCVAGVCHCKKGYYGIDCALSMGQDGKPVLLAGKGYATRAKRPWVYVYELPPELSAWYNHRRLDRPTHMLFAQRLLSSGARVADGDLADYYYIPVRQRSAPESSLLVDAIKYIQQHYPWWNRTQGHKHFVIQTGDWGRAEMDPNLLQLADNMTWLSHWGLTTDRHEKILRWVPSYRPEKDVVIPVFISPGHFVKFSMIHTPLNPANKAKPRDKAKFFFAGRICYNSKYPTKDSWPHCGGDHWAYSAGVREKVFVSHWNRSGYHVARSEKRYGLYLARSVYCLAPPGAGHGQRQIQALFMGCVPVTIADGVAEPFEPAVSWSDWGVRVAEADVPQLHTLLDDIGPQALAEKQARMRCAAQHMLYSSITGGVFGEDGAFDAFETALEVLRVRAAHPDARQEDFRKLDAAFDAFMDCREPPGPRPAFSRLSGLLPDAPALAQLQAEEAAEAAAEAAEAAARGSKGSRRGDREDEDGDAAEEDDEEEDGDAAGDEDAGVDGGERDEAASGNPAAGLQVKARPPAAPGTPPLLALCSHAYADIHNHDRSCYYVMRGGGYMGVPGGAICARGFKSRLAQCPRLWA
ncbi:hypothetical protein HXX76_009940 [Chlamydomonas incerta]|uniref:Exostosin GT47 domain-containing protein n=1 Tax=Chlamydomonas incerta TaxID=51695 RepID=A0A835T1W4_CHLIN|nr:hypothetical protein HXX76_009940 [Chlamydomonas incerta]|eukprot:KAG2430415.1 hypothetical protein HXX76_009940 [Chlamydomonas incerta]